jgi:hypothetical protein
MTIMKKILMAAVALICMTMTSVVFSSCGDDKDDDKKTVVYYKYADIESMQCVQSEEGEAQAKAFAADLAGVLSSIQSREVTDDDVINMTQRVVDMYNNKMIEGTFKLQTSRNASDWSTLKRFTLTADPKYKN